MPKTIVHTINARGNVMLDVTRKYFKLSPQQMHREIQAMLRETSAALAGKGIQYADLKSALVPQVGRREMALVVDSQRVDFWNYAIPAQERLLNLLDRSGTRAVLSGDYLDHGLPQNQLRDFLVRDLVPAAEVDFGFSAQFYVIYVNNLTDEMVRTIDAGFRTVQGYVGYVDMTYGTPFKWLLSLALPNDYIQHRNTIITGHEPDRPVHENTNLIGFPFEEAGYQLRSFPSSMTGVLLAYKVERPPMRNEEVDAEFSLNAVTPHTQPLDVLDIIVDERKFEYLWREKSESLRRIGLLGGRPEGLQALITERITQNYIYSMAYNDEFDVIQFNTVLEVRDVDGRPFRVTAGLKYQPEDKQLSLITLF